MDTISRLRDALEQAAEAMASARLDALLACEPAIENALAGLRPIEHLSPVEQDQIRAEVERARVALTRCRRLGTALDDFIRASFEAQGRGGSYSKSSGAAQGGAEMTYAGQVVNERV